MKVLDALLLLALPASGKSEIRKYLAHVSPGARRGDFHLGPTVQLDDFPYVHLMRRIDDELAAGGLDRLFFQAPDRPFRDPRDWGTLIHLVNEDYSDAARGAARGGAPPNGAAGAPPTSRGTAVLGDVSEGEWLLQRFDRALSRAGAGGRLAGLSSAARKALAQALEGEAAQLREDKAANCPDTFEGRTLLIEFARGGPQGASMPLAEPLGYRHSLSLLDSEILRRAAVLYIWVTPEESRRKNEERADPKDPGSILHHGVPRQVMLEDYGCDDMDWLEASSPKPGALEVRAHGKVFHLPFARFDNRQDKTSFVRQPSGSWPPEKVRELHEGLKAAFGKLAPVPDALSGGLL